MPISRSLRCWLSRASFARLAPSFCLASCCCSSVLRLSVTCKRPASRPGVLRTRRMPLACPLLKAGTVFYGPAYMSHHTSTVFDPSGANGSGRNLQELALVLQVTLPEHTKTIIGTTPGPAACASDPACPGGRNAPEQRCSSIHPSASAAGSTRSLRQP